MDLKLFYPRSGKHRPAEKETKFRFSAGMCATRHRRVKKRDKNTGGRWGTRQGAKRRRAVRSAATLYKESPKPCMDLKLFYPRSGKHRPAEKETKFRFSAGMCATRHRRVLPSHKAPAGQGSEALRLRSRFFMMHVARLHLLSQIMPRQSSPAVFVLRTSPCQAGFARLRPWLAEAKSRRSRDEDWWR